MALVWLIGIVTLLSINGATESKLETGEVGGLVFGIILAGIFATFIGYFVGGLLPEKFHLVFICIFDGFIISLIVYTFLMTWTGYWFILLINSIVMTAVCSFLSTRYYEQMKIQGTAFLGSWMITRGVSLMIGGYPNELQTIQWLQSGYILSTSSSFFIYMVTIVILFLVG